MCFWLRSSWRTVEIRQGPRGMVRRRCGWTAGETPSSSEAEKVLVKPKFKEWQEPKRVLWSSVFGRTRERESARNKEWNVSTGTRAKERLEGRGKRRSENRSVRRSTG